MPFLIKSAAGMAVALPETRLQGGALQTRVESGLAPRLFRASTNFSKLSRLERFIYNNEPVVSEPTRSLCHDLQVDVQRSVTKQPGIWFALVGG